MAVANHDQENKDQNAYYHPDPKLEGWTFMSISPMDPVLEPLLGKTIVNKRPEPKRVVNKTPEPKPITPETNTGSQKRMYNACFPFGHSQEIDDLLAKTKKSKPQTNSQTTNYGPNRDNPRSNATTASNILQSPQSSTITQRHMSQSPQNATSSQRLLPKLTAFAITKYLPKESTNDSKKTVAFDPELYKGLSEEQKRIHDLIVNDKKSVFFSGSAGTGKSVLLRAIINTLQSTHEEGEVAVTASTGIAALNIGGVTLHKFSYAGLGKDPVDKLVEKINNNRSYMSDWLRVKVLILDEVSMIDGHFLDKIEQVARQIRKQRKVFGGIQLVISGDFYQLPPVNKTGNVILAFESRCWSQMIEKSLLLKTCFRQKDKEFARMLDEIRVARVSAETERKFKALSRKPRTKMDIIPADLYPTRLEVDQENIARLAKLPGEEHVYMAKDHGNTHFLETCMAPARLVLKVGAQVMLIKNIEQTLVNGSMGIVRGFSGQGDSKMPVVEFTNGRKMTITERSWEYEQPRQPTTTRTQIPLLLAWAFTIHKAQGQTIEYVRVDLKKAFEVGQAYVALSRATCMEQLQVLNFDKELVRAHPKVTEFYERINVDE